MTENDYFSMQAGWIVRVTAGGLFPNTLIRLDEKDSNGIWSGTIVVSDITERINLNLGKLTNYQFYEIVSRGEPERRYNKLKGLYDTERI